jgi:hypothetical protein
MNEDPGVHLPASKIERRPSFDLAVLAEASGPDVLVTQLAWLRLVK